MTKALSLACALILMCGCARASPSDNLPPVAHVPAISYDVTSGEMVRLSGNGVDEDGDVVGFLWRSDLDGELSRVAIFETSSLSVGHHTIYFSVQDNKGAWSDEVRQSVTVRLAAAPAPVIYSFTSSSRSIKAGQSTLLSWNVSGATSVVVDQGIGSVPSNGTVTIAPVSTTTYVLTAESDGSTATATVTVMVEPVTVALLTAHPDISGYVRFSGYAPYGEVYVGDDEADRGIRGFLTYYLADIPANAHVLRVIVDMGGYTIPYDDPFHGIGCLSAFEHPYNTLQGQYRMPGLPDTVEKWCSIQELETKKESKGIRDALITRLGEDRLQLRLQFADRESDVDQSRDIVRWPGSRLPSLIVEYVVDEE